MTIDKKEVQALGVYKLNKDAVVPDFQTDGSACFDLTANLQKDGTVKLITQANEMLERPTIQLEHENQPHITLHSKERALIPTGLIFDIPTGYCLEVYPRSGTSFKLGLGLSNSVGMIDSDYINELFVSVINQSNVTQVITNGERIAQAKLVPLVPTEVKEIKTKPKQKTTRTGGFGSTGVKS